MLTKEIEEMKVEEKLELARELWHSIKFSEPWDESVPEWHREILEERLKYSLEHPEEGRPWKEVLQEIRSGLRSKK